MKTGDRKLASAQLSNYTDHHSPEGTMGMNEADSNADTCCLGTNFLVLSMSSRTADVYPYDSSYSPIVNVPIVSGATAYDDDNTGETYILVFNELLYYGPKLDHSLLNPNQLRMHGLGFWDNPFDTNHELSIDTPCGLVIPLIAKGTKIAFQSRVPTREELRSCTHIEMTSRREWNPHSVVLGEINMRSESAYGASIKSVTVSTHPFKTSESIKYQYEGFITSEDMLNDISPSYVQLKELIIGNINIVKPAQEDIPARCLFISRERHNKLSAESIAELWCIGLKRAKATLLATTQQETRSALLPISRRYQVDMRYNIKRLNGKFAIDTIYSLTNVLVKIVQILRIWYIKSQNQR